MEQYSTLLLNPQYSQVLQFIIAHNLSYSIEGDRCVFSVPHGVITTKLLVQFPQEVGPA
jgi:hypothetical protein